MVFYLIGGEPCQVLIKKLQKTEPFFGVVPSPRLELGFSV